MSWTHRDDSAFFRGDRQFSSLHHRLGDRINRNKTCWATRGGEKHRKTPCFIFNRINFCSLFYPLSFSFSLSHTVSLLVSLLGPILSTSFWEVVALLISFFTLFIFFSDFFFSLQFPSLFLLLLSLPFSHSSLSLSVTLSILCFSLLFFFLSCFFFWFLCSSFQRTNCILC